VRGLFVPGWGAPPSLYAERLPRAWTVVRPPTFAATQGRLDRYVEWLHAVTRRERDGVALGGHSMGAALAVLAAHEHPDRVSELLLVAPAGLPLAKPMTASLRDFARQLASGSYPREILGSILAAGRAPRAAVRLARSVHALDLGRELKALRARGVRVTVVGCASDTLTTPMHCRRVAALAGGDYRELSVAGGHMWMLHHPEEFALLF
jgi:pimeloyl-ACP methyl ester carboxylesterase